LKSTGKNQNHQTYPAPSNTYVNICVHGVLVKTDNAVFFTLYNVNKNF
jgi:hypothetical protein